MIERIEDRNVSAVEPLVSPRVVKEKLPPTIHACYAPTFEIRPGDPVTFKVRTFRADIGNETGTSPTAARP